MARKPKAAPLPDATRPTRKEHVAAWRDIIQAGCLNDTARACVGTAAEHYYSMFEAIERSNQAQEHLEAVMEAFAQDPDNKGLEARLKVAAMMTKRHPSEVEVRFKLGPLVDKLLGRAQAANHAEVDVLTHKMQQFDGLLDQSLEGFGPTVAAAKPAAKPRKPRKPRAKKAGT